jgi:hypothetical protein
VVDDDGALAVQDGWGRRAPPGSGAPRRASTAPARTGGMATTRRHDAKEERSWGKSVRGWRQGCRGGGEQGATGEGSEVGFGG